MLKQTVQFEDFDGVNKTKVLYFNLTRVEVIDNLELQKEFEDVQEMIGTATRNFEMHEIRIVLELVKKLIKLSYGVQRTGSDGELRFTKQDPEIWNEFTETAAYDSFLIGLFEDPVKATAFLMGIWPKEITKGLDIDQMKLPGMPVKMNGQPLVDRIPEEHQEPTREALLEMTKEQFDEVAGSDPTKMSSMMLQVAFQRRGQGN